MTSSPVYKMMSKTDTYDIVLIAVMDMVLKYLIDKNSGNKSRAYRLERIHNMLMDYESRYEGSISESMGDKADSFNASISAAMTELIKE